MTIAPTLTAPAAPSGATLHNVLTPDTRVKVSSGTSKDGKSILDASNETCWTSDNLPPNSDPSTSLHSISFKLNSATSLSRLHSLSLTFAGGFSPMSFDVLASQDGKTWSAAVPEELFPMDTNAKQYFLINSLEDTQEVQWLRLQLKGSTDDYGRVIVYQVELFAH
ncbi:hypothetical protein PHBOTO_006381 [Pseudozyma hubeiensis]|nr:hypothetical protein PHBOTO_006381 [Pseudozyma hubeiensis]